ncbi:MAG: hypothetical protein R6V35_02370 [Candidatus Nanohaloarchaea archaeon]
MSSPSLLAEIKEIEEQYSYQEDVFEQSVRISPSGLEEISIFDKKVLVDDSNVGEALELEISLTHFEEPKLTEREPGFYRPEDPSNQWNYEVVGNVVQIEEVELTSDNGEEMILNIGDHNVSVTTRQEFENLEKGQRIILSNNRVDLESIR